LLSDKNSQEERVVVGFAELLACVTMNMTSQSGLILSQYYYTLRFLSSLMQAFAIKTGELIDCPQQQNRCQPAPVLG
jgi:hypothetical protein